jgi:hypothetical protein
MCLFFVLWVWGVGVLFVVGKLAQKLFGKCLIYKGLEWHY